MKRKRALLESNPDRDNLMSDGNVRFKRVFPVGCPLDIFGAQHA